MLNVGSENGRPAQPAVRFERQSNFAIIRRTTLS